MSKFCHEIKDVSVLSLGLNALKRSYTNTEVAKDTYLSRYFFSSNENPNRNNLRHALDELGIKQSLEVMVFLTFSLLNWD